MRMLQTVLALAISIGTASVASAVCESKKCPASEFGEAVQAVRDTIAAECKCDQSSKSTRKNYKKCVKALTKAAKVSNQLTAACSKAAKKCSTTSICTKPAGAVACCQVKGNGKLKAYIAKDETKCAKKGTACSAFNDAADACTSDGSCATTTSTSSSTITTTSSSTSTSSSSSTTVTPATTTTTSTAPTCSANCPVGLQSFDFTTTSSTDACGVLLDGSNNTLANVGCGGLDIGGGLSIVAEGPVPDGSVNRFVATCDGDNCEISASNCAGPLTGGGSFNCTTTGCFFGTPLPIPGPPATCVINSFKAPAFGSVNKATGEAIITMPLNAQTYLTGDIITPCPYCGGTVIDPDTEEPFPLEGSLAEPKTGTCVGGATPDAACTTTNSNGLTNECLPGGSTPEKPCNPDGSLAEQECADGSTNLGGIEVTLANTTTSNSTLSNPNGFFCPGQEVPDPPKAGCFGAHIQQSSGGSKSGEDCRVISVTGSPMGPLTLGTPAPLTLGSAFCIPAIPTEGGALVNLSANLPGPGAVALFGTGTLSDDCPVAASPSGAFLALD